MFEPRRMAAAVSPADVPLVYGGPARNRRLDHALMPCAVESARWLDLAARCACADALHEECDSSPIALALRRVERAVSSIYTPWLAAVCLPDGRVRLAACVSRVDSRVNSLPVVEVSVDHLPFCEACFLYEVHTINCSVTKVCFSPEGRYLLVLSFRNHDNQTLVHEFDLDAEGGPTESTLSGLWLASYGKFLFAHYLCDDELVIRTYDIRGVVLGIVSRTDPELEFRRILCKDDRTLLDSMSVDDCQRDPARPRRLALLTKQQKRVENEIIGPFPVVMVIDCPPNHAGFETVVWKFSPAWQVDALEGGCLQFSLDGHFLCVGLQGEILIMNSSSGQPIYRLIEPSTLPNHVYSTVAMRPRGDQVLGLAGGNLFCWQLPGTSSLCRLSGLAVLAALRDFSQITSLPLTQWGMAYLKLLLGSFGIDRFV